MKVISNAFSHAYIPHSRVLKNTVSRISLAAFILFSSYVYINTMNRFLDKEIHYLTLTVSQSVILATANMSLPTYKTLIATYIITLAVLVNMIIENEEMRKLPFIFLFQGVSLPIGTFFYGVNKLIRKNEELLNKKTAQQEAYKNMLLN